MSSSTPVAEAETVMTTKDSLLLLWEFSKVLKALCARNQEKIKMYIIINHKYTQILIHTNTLLFCSLLLTCCLFLGCFPKNPT